MLRVDGLRLCVRIKECHLHRGKLSLHGARRNLQSALMQQPVSMARISWRTSWCEHGYVRLRGLMDYAFAIAEMNAICTVGPTRGKQPQTNSRVRQVTTWCKQFYFRFALASKCDFSSRPPLSHTASRQHFQTHVICRHTALRRFRKGHHTNPLLDHRLGRTHSRFPSHQLAHQEDRTHG